MELHESAEDYLETILILKEKNGKVRSIDIATELDVTRPSVSVAMKRLAENGYISVDESGFITMTKEGKSVAEKTYKKHKLLVSVLEAMGVSHKTAEKEACKIEHVISDTTVNCISKYYKNNMAK